MNINLTAPFCTTSYGMTALNIVKALDESQNEISVFPIGNLDGNDIPSQFHKSLQNSINRRHFFDPLAPSIRLYHQFSLDQHVGKGKRIGWPIFELDTFNEIELHHLNAQDELIVCSKWAKHVLGKNGIKLPIHVVPLGVDASIFHPNYHKSYLKRKFDNSTVFINVGKIELRKHDILLECFEKAFDNGENVELHMVWKNRLLEHMNMEEMKSWENMYLSSKLGDRITLYDWLPSENNVAALLANADCGVFPSHSEGFNFGLLQSMAVGIQTICTNYSAHTEYANSENSLLIDIDETETAYDGIWFHGQGNWAKFEDKQKDQLIEYMRNIHKRKQNGENLFNTNGINTAKSFNWENSAFKLINILR